VKPEDLLDPATLPDDLQWIVTQYRLRPDDPVFLLIAWHWHRANASEDTLRAALSELKAAIDGRVRTVKEAAETVAGITDALDDAHAVLEHKPAELSAELEKQLGEPITAALSRLKELETSLAPLGAKFKIASRRQLLAVFVTGVALGALSAVIAVLP
jgi:hypothetical protein